MTGAGRERVHDPATSPRQPASSDPETGQDHAYAAIHGAVAQLAGVCDFAESLDGQGFNATDTWLGHALAAMPVSAWSEDAALTAWDMLRKYRGQLAGFGISYDHLPRPQGADELEETRREAARDRARQSARQWRDQQYRKANSYVRCDGEGEKVTLAFPYDPETVNQAKAIKGREFNPGTKANVYPFTSLPQVVALADAREIEVAPEVRALVPAAVALVKLETAQPNIYTDKAGRVVISAEYNPRLNEMLKAFNGGRSTWDARARVHRPPLHANPAEILDIAAHFDLTVSDDARAAIEAEATRQERNQAAATAFMADPMPVPGLADGLLLKPQQYPVVAFAREHRRVLIGDDMGWGKTLSSLTAVAVDGAYPVVVVCRPSLTLNWVAEIRRFFPRLSVHEASGTTPQPIPAGTDVVVIGSAALAAKPHKTETGAKEFGWVKTLETVEPKALIIDEGQDTKERGANRSQACEQLAGAVRARDGLVLNLTGTAILNRPRELCQQLTILGRISEFGGPKAFLWRYCLSETNDWGASYNGAQNLIELHDRLLRWGIMIRRADDAKLGLPPCREHVLRISPAQLDPSVMARYQQAEADLLAFLADQARQAAERLGEDPASAAVQATIRAQAAEHLVAINTLRQLAGQAKRGYVTAWIREHVAAGEKVMVAAHHREEVDAYSAEFGGLKLQGGQSVAEKEAAKAAFQQQPPGQAPVISVAIGAGGVGHTLTAAAIGIQAEQAWTPGETQQMKKRLHRIGQDRPVDYYITVAEGTIDEHLWAVVTTKQATLNAVLDGKTDTGTSTDEKSIAAELTWRLTQQGLGGSPESDTSQANRSGSHEPTSEPERDRHRDAPHGESQTASKAVSRHQPEVEDDQVGASEPDTVSSIGLQTIHAGARDHLVSANSSRLQVISGTETKPGHDDHDQPPRATQATTSPRAEASSQEQSAPRPLCAACRDAPAGPGGILCPACRVAIESRSSAMKPDEDSDDGHAPAQPTQPGDRLRECAHRYLEDGLLPVPAWAAKPDGGCCCPRGGDCPRPGKHPRSVHTGPGAHDYSWKPLACHSHAEVDERFADGGPYAAGNLMVAIPPGMMAIDQDDDDGGAAALTTLRKDLGELPETLSHRTPHGQHLIYRTPPGWTGRAWVGKDPANPVPAGVDLRMPGQILMVPPSTVPGPAGPVSYGPTTGDHVAPLPAAYLTAWTPPQPPPRRASRPVPVPADSADRAAKYVHDAMTGIAADLASHKEGGRNNATYQAGLKAGSLLGAARATPGAEQAAAAWTDEAAEEALMDAAERNGYIGKDGQAEARRAIRSGLRNGLRNPRALPDFTTTRPSSRDAGQDRSPRPARPQRNTAARAVPRVRRWQDMVPTDVRRQIESADHAARDRLRAAQAAYRQALTRHTSSGRSPATESEVQHAKAEADAAYQAYTQDGRHITGRHDAAMLRWATSITTTQQSAAATAIVRDDSPRMQANRAALAASEAYRAGDFDQARQLTDQAAALDPSRAELWQQHRKEIAARQLVLAARAAYAEGDKQRGDKLLADARQLDPRMRAIWNINLSALPATQRGHQTRPHGLASAGPLATACVHRAADPGPQQRRPAAPAQVGTREPQPAQPSASPGRGPSNPTPSPRDPGQNAQPRWPDQPALRSTPQEDPATPTAASPTASTARPEPGSRWQRIHAENVQPAMVVRNPYGGSRGRGVVASEVRQMPNGTVEFEVEDGRTGRFRRHFELDYDHHATQQLATERATTKTAATAADTQPSREILTDASPEPEANRSASADWRDQIIATAREPWQPSPIQPFNSALLWAPDAHTQSAEIEADR
jgi:tetratricopeptide (TPR) repeat protein